jgi:hypothetical protein
MVFRKEWQFMSTEEKIFNTRLVNEESLESFLEELEGRYSLAANYFQAVKPTGFTLAEFKSDTIPIATLETKAYKDLEAKFNEMLEDLLGISLHLEELLFDKSYPRAFMLRYMIVLPIEYRGRSVVDLLTDTISTLLKICSFFECRGLAAQLSKMSLERRRLNAKMSEKNHIDSGRVLESILSGKVYQETTDAD